MPDRLTTSSGKARWNRPTEGICSSLFSGQVFHVRPRFPWAGMLEVVLPVQTGMPPVLCVPTAEEATRSGVAEQAVRHR